jgi:mono/diheme cytochrome c family protein
MNSAARLAALTGVVLCTGGFARAEDPDLGRIEFMANCAQCHGTDAKGDGIIASFLTVPPPDLTAIQRDNDGVFPAGVLHEIIEGGGARIGAHGSREMPAWGTRFTADAYLQLGPPLDPEQRDAFIQERIEALVDYIARLQVE